MCGPRASLERRCLQKRGQEFRRQLQVTLPIRLKYSCLTKGKWWLGRQRDMELQATWRVLEHVRWFENRPTLDTNKSFTQGDSGGPSFVEESKNRYVVTGARFNKNSSWPPLKQAYLRAYDARALFTNDARALFTNDARIWLTLFWRDLTRIIRARVISYVPEKNWDEMTRIWRA